MKKLQYQNPHSTQTLREALEEYRSYNKEILNYKNEDESNFFFVSHDVCHVLFGCNTNLEDEAITDTWTIFGSDVSLKKFYRFTKLEGHQEIIKEVGLLGVIKTFFRSIPRIIKVIFRSRKMKTKWKWDKYEVYMEDKLFEIRKNFKIEIV